MTKINKDLKNNIVTFPKKLNDGEREVEAIVFAALEPLDIDTIESVSYTHLTLPTILLV